MNQVETEIQIDLPFVSDQIMEIWKDISEYKGYQISNRGRIKSFQKNPNGIIMKPSESNLGYLTISFYNSDGEKRFYVHRLVAKFFKPNFFNKPHINHKNGIKTDNRVENLEWITPSENNQHAYNVGLKKANGENNGRSKLNSFQVRVIRKTVGLNNTELSRIFNISRTVISLIKSNKIWIN